MITFPNCTTGNSSWACFWYTEGKTSAGFGWTNVPDQLSWQCILHRAVFLKLHVQKWCICCVPDMAGDLVFCSEFGSHGDATCEKVYKSLACCFKQTQKLTIPDSWWGFILNWMKTQTTYPEELPCVSHTCFSQNVKSYFSLLVCKENVIIIEQVLYWERVENTVGAAWHPWFTLLWGDSVGSLEELTQPINSSFWHCMSRTYRTDV